MRQHCDFAQLTTRPLESRRDTTTDDYGNIVTTLEFDGPLQVLDLSACHTVTVAPVRKIESALSWEDAESATRARPELRAYCASTPLTEPRAEIHAYIAPLFAPGRVLLDAVSDWSSQLHRDVVYAAGVTDVSTTAADVLRLRRGVCQDLAHLAIAGLRALGLATRYVSGYADVLDGVPRLGRHQAHAWASVFVPDSGWFDFDPTCNQPVDERYITLACGRDYGDVIPVQGDFTGDACQRFEVLVDIERL